MRKGYFSIVCFLRSLLLLAGVTAAQLLPAQLERLEGSFPLTGTILEARDVSTITRGPEGMGLIAADEGASIQIIAFAPDGQSARIRDNVALLSPSSREVDFEASTWNEGWYYVTGSHGAAKKRGTYNPDRANIFRFRIDPEQAGIQDLQRASLAGLFRRHPDLAPFHRQPLQQRGLNIEGLGARAGDAALYVGLRGPNLEGHALVLRVDPEALFSGETKEGALMRIPVGPGLGIRAMTAIGDGFLLVLGNAGSESVKRFPETVDYEEGRPSELFYWNPDSGQSKHLGTFPRIQKGKEEGILLLSEEETGAFEFLIVYDSITGGGLHRFRGRL